MTDSITDHDDDDLTPHQEYTIAGVVILLFGLLYWFLNYGWNVETDSGLTGARASGADVAMMEPVRSSLANVVLGAGVTTPVAGSSPAAPAAKPVSTPVAPAATVAAVAGQTPPPAAATVTDASSAVPPTQVATDTAAQDSGPVGPASPKAETAVQTPAQVAGKPEDQAAQPLVYKLPDGSEVAIGSTGFEAGLLQAIVKGEANKPIIFDKITFDKGSARLNVASDQQIRATAALLNTYPNTKILIRGHTDETGVSSSNTELSLMRANEMGVALVNLGIDRSRLRIMGMGDSNPIDSNATEEGRRNNRRVDALIIP